MDLSTTDIGQIRKCKTFQCPSSSVLKGNTQGILLLKNGGEVCSFLYFTISSEEQYLMIAYSYTFPQHRKKGYNTTLRNQAIDRARSLGLAYVVSMPFEGAASIPILVKFGFERRSDGSYWLNLAN